MWVPSEMTRTLPPASITVDVGAKPARSILLPGTKPAIELVGVSPAPISSFAQVPRLMVPLPAAPGASNASPWPAASHTPPRKLLGAVSASVLYPKLLPSTTSEPLPEMGPASVVEPAPV